MVKDPVGLHYFRFQEEEYAILQMLDGQTSLDEIKERFEAEFPPQKITLEELQQFLGMLHRSGLVMADVPGQGHQLRKRRGERKRKELLGAVSQHPLHPLQGLRSRAVARTGSIPTSRWFFSPAGVSCCAAAGALGADAGAGRVRRVPREAARRSTSSSASTTPSGWPWCWA